MAIFVKPKSSKGESKTSPPATEIVKVKVEENLTQRRFQVERKSKVNGVASAEASLIVNGKEKSIGRKSHYLLDMLTLDDE